MKKPHLQREAKENSTESTVPAIVADGGACPFASKCRNLSFEKGTEHVWCSLCHLDLDRHELARVIAGRNVR
jgi:LSD1 subclass zinc finger protein